MGEKKESRNCIFVQRNPFFTSEKERFAAVLRKHLQHLRCFSCPSESPRYFRFPPFIPSVSLSVFLSLSPSLPNLPSSVIRLFIFNSLFPFYLFYSLSFSFHPLTPPHLSPSAPLSPLPPSHSHHSSPSLSSFIPTSLSVQITSQE